MSRAFEMCATCAQLALLCFALITVINIVTVWNLILIACVIANVVVRRETGLCHKVVIEEPISSKHTGKCLKENYDK